jgi:hypothetical protein
MDTFVFHKVDTSSNVDNGFDEGTGEEGHIVR